MSKKIHQPHDRFFRKAMSDIRVARDFFEQYLPAEIRSDIDFDKLELQKESFVDKNLRSTSADVVYRTTFQQRPLYLYTLIEHLSTSPHLLPFRTLGYMLSVMQYHLDQMQTTELPIVYPLVFYTGERPFSGEKDFFALFGAQEVLARQTFLQPLHIIDVNQIDDEVLKKQVWFGITAFVMKHRVIKTIKHFEKIIGEWLCHIEERGGFDYAASVIHYVLREGDNDEETFIEKLTPYLTEKLAGETMTIAEQLIQKGLEQGMREGEHHLLLELLEHKFRHIPENYRQKLSSANTKTLLLWGKKILEAKTLDEIFQ